MFARMWHRRWISLGLVSLMAAGCQSMQKNTVSDASRQPVSQQPPDLANVKEGPAPEILPDTHVAAGRLHESQGRLARAAEQYRLATGAQPKHHEAYNRLGVVLDRLGKFAEADQAFARAIQIAPNRADLHNNLAFSYIMQGRWAEAQASLTKALQLQPEFPRARVNLGLVMAQQGRFEEGFENFRQVLRAEDAYYNIGLMYQSKKQPVEAAQAFKQALQANAKMVAAQKRLDSLPPEVVSEADKRPALFVFAVALTGKLRTGDIATNGPVVIPLPEANEADARSLEEPASDPAMNTELSDAPPAETDAAVPADPFAERMDANEWLFSTLVTDTPESSEPAAQEPPAGESRRILRWADPMRLIRTAIEPVEQLLGSLTIEGPAGGEDPADSASPLPPEVPAPDAEDPPVYDLMVPPSTAPAE